MKISLNDILAFLKESNFDICFHGNENAFITGYSSTSNLKNNTITWLKNDLYFKEGMFDEVTNIFIVGYKNLNIDIKVKNAQSIHYITCGDPKSVFFSILEKFFKREKYAPFVSPNSTIETNNIGKRVYIGHNCFIGKDVIISDNVIIKNNVTIENSVKIGDNTIIHSGVTIGTDGFGYFKDHEGNYVKVSHFGGITIGKNVEIGANVCIDRGTLDDTIIGDNVKIDNLCHIGHNVTINQNCLIIAGTVLGGSVVIGQNTHVAPGVIIKNQVSIGENCIIGMGTVVLKDIDDNKVAIGVPAKILKDNF